MTKSELPNRYLSQCTMHRPIATHIDEPTIARVLHEFYLRVRRDLLLGDIFNARIADWGAHLERMGEFWSSIALASRRYHGHPLSKHLSLPVSAPHFDRWLELFTSTVREICTPAAAELLAQRALLIARSLEGGIASAQGIVLARDERLAPSQDSTLQPRREHP